MEPVHQKSADLDLHSFQLSCFLEQDSLTSLFSTGSNQESVLT